MKALLLVISLLLVGTSAAAVQLKYEIVTTDNETRTFSPPMGRSTMSLRSKAWTCDSLLESSGKGGYSILFACMTLNGAHTGLSQYFNCVDYGGPVDSRLIDALKTAGNVNGSLILVESSKQKGKLSQIFIHPFCE